MGQHGDSLPGKLEERARDGDEDAGQRLLEQHRRRLLRMVTLRLDPRLRPRFGASDVVQDAMVRAWEGLPAYLSDPVVPIYVWLRQLAWNRLIELRRMHLDAGKRSLQREVRIEASLPHRSTTLLADRLAGTVSSPSGRLQREELRRRVLDALETLEEPYREVLELRYLEHLRLREVAAVLGISDESAKKRQYRALRKLRDLLDRPGDSESGEASR